MFLSLIVSIIDTFLVNWSFFKKIQLSTVTKTYSHLWNHRTAPFQYHMGRCTKSSPQKLSGEYLELEFHQVKFRIQKLTCEPKIEYQRHK